VLLSELFGALALGGGFETLLFFGRLLEALAALDIGNDSVLLSGLGEALQSALEWLVGFDNDSYHRIPRFKCETAPIIEKFLARFMPTNL
jgi:hypothetical protein